MGGTDAVDELGFRSHIQLLSGGDEPETRLHLKHYADEQWRDAWLEEFPDYDMPPHEDPPYDRDSRLSSSAFWKWEAEAGR